MYSKFKECCMYNTAIAGVAGTLYYLGWVNHLLHIPDNILVHIMTFIIILELSKLMVEMLIGSEAPIMMRYLLAGIVVGASREFYISMVEKNWEGMVMYSVAVAVFLLLRHYAIHSTKDGR